MHPRVTVYHANFFWLTLLGHYAFHAAVGHLPEACGLSIEGRVEQTWVRDRFEPRLAFCPSEDATGHGPMWLLIHRRWNTTKGTDAKVERAKAGGGMPVSTTLTTVSHDRDLQEFPRHWPLTTPNDRLRSLVEQCPHQIDALILSDRSAV